MLGLPTTLNICFHFLFPLNTINLKNSCHFNNFTKVVSHVIRGLKRYSVRMAEVKLRQCGNEVGEAVEIVPVFGGWC